MSLKVIKTENEHLEDNKMKPDALTEPNPDEISTNNCEKLSDLKEQNNVQLKRIDSIKQESDLLPQNVDDTALFAIHTSITIKAEPEEFEEPQTNFQGNEGMERLESGFERPTGLVKLVKVEQFSDDDDSEDGMPLASLSSLDAATPPPRPVFLIKANNRRKTKKTSDDSDEDYLPHKLTAARKKEKGELTGKPTYRLKKNETKPTFPEDITIQIEIVQITDEERKKEHAETLASRSHCKFVCTPCALGFVLEEPYTAHMAGHSEAGGAHECDVCGTRHKTAHTLYGHYLRHFRRYRCVQCGALFKERDKAACHVMAAHERRAFECRECGKAFKRPQYLRGHIDQHHTKKNAFECPVCQRVFHERGRWRCHVRNHNEEARRTQVSRFKCSVCGKGLRTEAYLQRHMSTHSSEWQCRLCSKVYNAKNLLTKHMRRTHNDSNDEWRCLVCGKVYDAKNLLTKHVRRVHSDTNAAGYPCPQCERVLTSRGMLSRHMRRMHLERTKNHQCDYCKRLYYSKAEVRSHIMWSHMRARGGHACACGRVFRTPARLRDHALSHSGLPARRDHKCEQCGKGFGSRQVLTRHMKVHTDETYPCVECGATFKTQSYVKIHHKLKHLNMTRAQIKAQCKRPKPITVEKGMVLKNTLFIEPSVYVECQSTVKVENDVEENDGDLRIPTFETFMDIQRE